VSPASSPDNPSLLFTGPGAAEVRSLAVPRPGRDEVLVRTRRSLVSTGTELTVLSGTAGGEEWRALGRYPFQPGYANAGEVLAVGEGVDSSWLGARVHNHGKHQAYTLSAADRLARIPDGVGDEEAVFTTLAKVAMNGLRRVAATWGESIAVVGLGLLGQLTCRLAGVIGLAPVFAAEPSVYRRGLLPERPGLHPWGAGLAELAAEIRERNRGRLADLVVEATGDPDLLPQELQLLRNQGRFLVLSSPRGASRFDFHDLCNRRSLTLVGAHGFSHPAVATPDNPWTSARHGELFLDLLATGAVETSSLVSHRISYSRAPEAYELLRAARAGGGEAMGVILEW